MANLPEKERVSSRDRHPVVESGKVPDHLLRETEGYLEKVEKEAELKKPVTDDQGQVLVTSPTAQDPKIVLPVGEGVYFNPKNWHKPVTLALRWLLEWSRRVAKANPGRTTFKEE